MNRRDWVSEVLDGSCARQRKLGDPQKPLPAPKTLVSPSEWPWSFDATKHLGMVSNDPRVPDWWKDIRTSWTFGEFGAHAALRRFLNSDALENFEDRARLIANESNTSSLSPHLRFGELSPRYVYHSILQARERQGYENTIAASATFLRRLAWRDLSYWSVVEFPFICDWSIRPQYESEKWSYDAETFERWSRGQTGYPLVDAGMRQLWRTGWMPNYVRHICAQFLIEYLHLIGSWDLMVSLHIGRCRPSHHRIYVAKWWSCWIRPMEFVMHLSTQPRLVIRKVSTYEDGYRS